MKKKKALFITPRPIFPITGGDQIRWAQSLYLLSNHFLVDVFFLDEFDSENKVKEYADYVNNVFHYKISRWRCYLNSLKFLFNGKPMQVNYYYFTEAENKIKHILSNYDAVYCNLIRTTEYAIHATNIIRYVDFVDSISKNYNIARKKATGLKKLIYSVDYYLCRKYEKKALDNFNACSIISQIDGDFISTKKKIHVINNMVDSSLYEECKEHIQMDKQEDIIVFLGKMSYEPNILAVTHFVRKIYPAIQRYRRDVQFYIVGTNPTEKVVNLQTYSGVIVTGYVDNPYDYLIKAKIVIAPMVTGAGIQNKIIQAMAIGCCVVTTPIGAEGLYIKHDEISIVEANHEFAEEVIRLLDNNDIRSNMSEKAKEYVRDHLSMSRIENRFHEFMKNGEMNFINDN